MKKLIIQTVILVMFPFLGHSQSEFSIFGGYGFTGLHCNAIAGNTTIGSGAQYGLGYRYFFGDAFGVGMNVAFTRYKTGFSAEKIDLAYRAKDIEGTEFEFRSSVTGYEETQDVAFLQIPVLLHLQIGNFYLSGGVKAGIPLFGQYGSTASALKNSGYYIEDDYEYTTQRFMGFGAFNEVSSQGDFEYRINPVFSVTLETGLKVELGYVPSFYFGFYVDYGLNNTTYKGSSQFVGYNTASPADFTLNSAVSSQYSQNKPIADKIAPFAIGVKMAFALGRNY